MNSLLVVDKSYCLYNHTGSSDEKKSSTPCLGPVAEKLKGIIQSRVRECLPETVSDALLKVNPFMLCCPHLGHVRCHRDRIGDAISFADIHPKPDILSNIVAEILEPRVQFMHFLVDCTKAEIISESELITAISRVFTVQHDIFHHSVAPIVEYPETSVSRVCDGFAFGKVLTKLLLSVPKFHAKLKSLTEQIIEYQMTVERDGFPDKISDRLRPFVAPHSLIINHRAKCGKEIATGGAAERLSGVCKD